MTLYDFLMFSAVASVAALVAHWFVRRYWLAVLVGVLSVSFINIGYELIKHNFAVRPSDVAFWLPMLFMMGMVYALPAVAITGIPFHVVRRRRKSNAA